MAALLYLRAALEDMERLTRFLAESDPPAALDTQALIESAIEILNRHPLIGRPMEDGTRELVISRGRSGYVAIYRYDEEDDRALIAGIRHQREAGYS